MKKLSILMIMVAVLLLGVATASAELLSAAAQQQLRQATGHDILCLDHPEGKVAADLPQEQWVQVSPEWLYSDSAEELMYFRASGATYSFSLAVNQIAIANCITAGKVMYLYIQGSYIRSTGCTAQ